MVSILGFKPVKPLLRLKGAFCFAKEFVVMESPESFDPSLSSFSETNLIAGASISSLCWMTGGVILASVLRPDGLMERSLFG